LARRRGFGVGDLKDLDGSLGEPTVVRNGVEVAEEAPVTPQKRKRTEETDKENTDPTD
jgi:hypothetical protein